MRFIADVMLGKLAKRMRLRGFDVLYDHAASDNEIIRLSLEQDRVILTRDTGLAARPVAANHLFIKSDFVKEQLHQVLGTFHLETRAEPLTRCSLCNENLSPVSRHDVEDQVPEYVHEKHGSFSRCEKCERIYWEGTHVKKLR